MRRRGRLLARLASRPFVRGTLGAVAPLLSMTLLTIAALTGPGVVDGSWAQAGSAGSPAAAGNVYGAGTPSAAGNAGSGNVDNAGTPSAADDAQAAAPALYFFSPDWRPPDFGKLTVAIEAALAAGPWHVAFQAFTRYEDFRKQVLAKPPAFMIAPSWLEVSSDNDLGLPLRVIARPLRRGKTTYRKAVMSRSDVDSLDDLARRTVAATLYSMSPGSTSAVLDSFHLASDAARVVAVPKDIDALLALNFGQVDAALVTSEQYDLFANSSPAEAARLRVLAFSPEIRLPPVYACGAIDDATSRRLTDLLVAMSAEDSGRQALGMLGFDGFVSGATADASTKAAGQAQNPATGAAPDATRKDLHQGPPAVAKRKADAPVPSSPLHSEPGSRQPPTVKTGSDATPPAATTKKAPAPPKHAAPAH